MRVFSKPQTMGEGN